MIRLFIWVYGFLALNSTGMVLVHREIHILGISGWGRSILKRGLSFLFLAYLVAKKILFPVSVSLYRFQVEMRIADRSTGCCGDAWRAFSFR